MQAPAKERFQLADETVAPQRAAAMCLRADLGEKRLVVGQGQPGSPVVGRVPLCQDARLNRPEASLPSACAAALDHSWVYACLTIRARTGLRSQTGPVPIY